MDEIGVLRAFVTSLGIGLLMGLERERAKTAAPGVRTFSLAALAGTTAALTAQHSGSAWIIGAALLAMVALLVVAYARDPRRVQDPGTTTNAALLLCFLLGTLAGYGVSEIVVGVAITATALLYFKPELHGFSHRLSSVEMRAILQFAAVAFLLLPLLPDRDFGPWNVINPFRIGLLVVLISGLNLAGYAALKLLDHDHAVVAMGVLGGVVSSTATTLTFSRSARDGTVPMRTAGLIVVLANLTVLVRLALVSAVAAPQLITVLLPVLATALLAGLVIPAYRLWRLSPTGERPQLDVSNPADLRSAVGFALMFALVLLAAAGVHDLLGATGLLGVAALSGLTDVDAITLSTLQLQRQTLISAATAVTAIGVAYASNLSFKLSAVAVIGGRRLLREVAASFACVLAGLLLGIWWMS
ncbi:DUF4010 domain-containing protein [Fontimonas sp. SYSU GA230001]|uniref:MgtC/SapB family protein n=1 Tax=Fontimonas sp. SYSU GA230001 TaxID=3142450 RepID=UPI0032B5100D